MTQTQPQISHRNNAFDLIRLLLALLVVYTHSRLLGGFGDDWISHVVKHQTNPGTAAVLGFFGISGFLVSQSYCSAPKWRTFLKRRALRILPAFYFALFFCAFVAAPLLIYINSPESGPWHLGDAARFMERNAFLKVRSWTVAGEVAGLPYNESLDGALWSLFPEACCYLLILGVGLAGVLAPRRLGMVGIAALLFVTNFASCLSPNPLVPLLPSFLVLTSNTPFFLAFTVGASIYAFRESINFGTSGAVVTGLVCILMLKFGGWAIFGPVILPLWILHLAHCFRVRLWADLSYGIYVLHFPCEQLLAAWNLQRHGFAWFFLFSIIVSVACATISWFLVERPALLRK